MTLRTPAASACSGLLSAGNSANAAGTVGSSWGGGASTAGVGLGAKLKGSVSDSMMVATDCAGAA